MKTDSRIILLLSFLFFFKCQRTTDDTRRIQIRFFSLKYCKVKSIWMYLHLSNTRHIWSRSRKSIKVIESTTVTDGRSLLRSLTCLTLII